MIVKRMAKWVSLLLCAVLLLGALPLSASAAGTTVTLETKAARPGDVVTLELDLEPVSNTDGLELNLYFDDAVLEFVSAETTGFLNESMSMKDAVLVVGKTNLIRVTGIGAPASGGGVIARLTFRVKATAPHGLTAVTIDEASSFMMFSQAMAPVSAVNGGVTVDPNAAPNETAPSTTAPMNGVTAGTTVMTDANGKDVIVPAVTVVDNVNGATVTNVGGEPHYEYQIPIMVDSLSAEPGDEFEVYVSVLSATDVTLAAINVRFNSSALAFVKGEAVDSGEGKLTIVNEAFDADYVKISYFGDGIDLNGRVARLTFRVKDSAKKGDYRLTLHGTELHKNNEIVLPVEYHSGNVYVTKNGVGVFGNVWTYVIGAAVLALAAVAVVLFVKMKKNAPPKPNAAKPSVLTQGGDLNDDDI